MSERGDEFQAGLEECRGPDGKLDIEKVRAWEAALREAAEAVKDQVVVLGMIGIFRLQVCARGDLSGAELVKLVNRINPAGTRNGWTVDERTAAVSCADDAGRLHYVMVC